MHMSFGLPEAGSFSMLRAALTSVGLMDHSCRVQTFPTRCVFLHPPHPRNAHLGESRQAANEAVEAALSSADADREEACAELEASMKAEVKEQKKRLRQAAGRVQICCCKSAVANLLCLLILALFGGALPPQISAEKGCGAYERGLGDTSIHHFFFSPSSVPVPRRSHIPALAQPPNQPVPTAA